METINFKDFMDGSFKEKKRDYSTLRNSFSATMPLTIMLMPKLALAASADATFGNIHGAIMNMFDSGVVLIIIFAGAAWGFGFRPKAIEILLGVSCGYILARHAVDIRDFLKGI